MPETERAATPPFCLQRDSSSGSSGSPLNAGVSERARKISESQQPRQRHSIVAREFFNASYDVGPKLIIFMCGLPARGKSYISAKMKRYLNWSGYRTEIFNVGNRRRQDTTAAADAAMDGASQHSHLFFDPANATAKEKRDRWALDVLKEIIDWLEGGGKVAIHDATNSTLERRQLLVQAVQQHHYLSATCEFNYVFIESICTDTALMDANIRMKLHSPDYAHYATPEAALADFRRRMDNYERAYEPLGAEEERRNTSYIKTIDVGKKVVSFNVQGYLQSQIVFYLMNVHVEPRAIWLTTHGLSVEVRSKTQRAAHSVDDDRQLDAEGHRYSSALAQLIRSRYPPATASSSLSKQRPQHRFEVWTSFLKRSLEMAEHFPSEYVYKHSRILNELFAGEFALIKSDNDYHTGIYIERLRGLIIDLERVRSSVLIIARDTIISTLCAYFFDQTEPRSSFDVALPLHTAVCLQPMPYGTDVYLYEYVAPPAGSSGLGSFTERKVDRSWFWPEQV